MKGHGNTHIEEIFLPDLEAALLKAESTQWTPEIDAAIRKYYAQSAASRKLGLLVSSINQRFDRQFTVRHLENRAQQFGLQNHRNG